MYYVEEYRVRFFRLVVGWVKLWGSNYNSLHGAEARVRAEIRKNKLRKIVKIFNEDGTEVHPLLYQWGYISDKD